jgi:hypothetical protein
MREKILDGGAYTDTTTTTTTIIVAIRIYIGLGFIAFFEILQVNL